VACSSAQARGITAAMGIVATILAATAMRRAVTSDALTSAVVMLAVAVVILAADAAMLAVDTVAAEAASMVAAEDSTAVVVDSMAAVVATAGIASRASRI